MNVVLPTCILCACLVLAEVKRGHWIAPVSQTEAPRFGEVYLKLEGVETQT